MSKVTDLISSIDNLCDDIKSDASELREAISELMLPNEGDLLHFVDNIKDNQKSIKGDLSDLQDECDYMQGEIDEHEDEAECDIDTMIGKFSYKVDNPRDEETMELFTRCIQEIQPAKLQELLNRCLNNTLENVIKNEKDKQGRKAA